MGDEVSGDGHCQSHAKFEEQMSPVLHSYLQQPLHPRSFMATMVIPSSYDRPVTDHASMMIEGTRKRRRGKKNSVGVIEGLILLRSSLPLFSPKGGGWLTTHLLPPLFYISNSRRLWRLLNWTTQRMGLVRGLKQDKKLKKRVLLALISSLLK